MRVLVSRPSKYGGPCKGCGRYIAIGEETFKLDVGRRGHQTSGGNGQGDWVGRCCVPDPPDPAA